MRIETTETVRRFNAQTELVDIALDFAADQITDPGALIRLLQLVGQGQLGKTFEEAMRQVCIHGQGWPTGAGPDPDWSARARAVRAAELAPEVPNHPTKSTAHEDWCMCFSCCEASYIIEDNERIAREAKILYERDRLRNVVERLLNAYAWARKSTEPAKLHGAVRSAMEAIGEL